MLLCILGHNGSCGGWIAQLRLPTLSLLLDEELLPALVFGSVHDVCQHRQLRACLLMPLLVVVQRSRGIVSDAILWHFKSWEDFTLHLN